MRLRAALLAFACVGLSGCDSVQHYVSRQYYPAQPQFVIEYAPGSTTLDAAGMAAVSGATQLALKEPAATVQVVGYASADTTDPTDPSLSDTRAQAVASQLIADGLDASRVTSMARGATTYQFSPKEAERVEINVVQAGF
jgi:outer membrane protein OmpA-like peptidoglycan-associated protein